MGSKVFAFPDEVSHVTWWITNASGCYAVPGPRNEVTRKRSGSYSGAETPHYYAKLRAGEVLPLNAYECVDEDSQGTYGGQVSWYYPISPPCGGTWGTNSRGFILDMTEGLSSDALLAEMSRNVNINALIQQAIASAAPDLDALTGIMEVDKTVSMVLEARRTAKHLITEGLRRGIRSAAKAVSSAWLEWRYGWRLLGYDIQDICTMIEKPRIQFVAGRSGVDGPSKVVSSSGQLPLGNSLDGQGGISCWYSETQSVDTSYRANFIGKYRHETFNVLADPFVTAWELIPFSFVADWFVSLGDLLTAWTVLSRVEDYYTSVGAKQTVKVNARMTHATTSLAYHSNPSAFGSSSGIRTIRCRTPVSAFSLTPQFRVRLTSGRILDAAALLLTRLL